MDAGIIIRNQSAEYVLDSRFSNFEFVRKIRLSDITRNVSFQELANGAKVPDDENFSYEPFNFFFGYRVFFIYIRPNEYFFSSYNRNKNTSNCLILQGGVSKAGQYIKVNKPFIEVRCPIGEVNESVIFFYGEKANTASKSNFGFQVFNEHGQLVYDASKQYLKVIGIDNKSKSISNEGNVSIVNIGFKIFRRSWCAGKGWGELANFWAYENGEILMKEITLEDQTGKYVSNLESNLYYLLVDVTTL